MVQLELQESIQKIKQLLKSDDESNHTLAIQLMKGQGISVDNVINSISFKEDSENYTTDRQDCEWNECIIGFGTGWRYNNNEIKDDSKAWKILNYVHRHSLNYLQEIYNK